MLYDAVIIGAGITGCAVARYLSRYEGRFLVLERDEDVSTGTTKANSAIVHAGYDAENGSKMAKMNVEGSRMYVQLAKDLDFPYENNGSLVLCFDEGNMPKLQALYENGLRNGVEGLEIVDKKRLHVLEPHVSDRAIAALYAPTGAIVCPFQATIAMAENAAANEVDFKFYSEVTSITKTEEGWAVQTKDGVYETRAVVNAAGVYADVFHNMVSAKKIHITPRKGEYFLLDRTTGGFVKQTIFQLPGKMGKGVLVTPTVHGNTLVGPTSVGILDREATNTTAEGLAEVGRKAQMSVENLPMREVITSFAGLRAHEDGHDFVLGQPEDAPHFFDCAGIESPGLSSAPAIGLHTSDEIAEALGLVRKENFIATRKGFTDPNKLSIEERNELIRKEPAYGQIICRCETVTEGQIIDAIHRVPGAKSLDGVKRRVRAGMGRCQAGFCSPRVMEILARELAIPLSEVTKSGGSSRIITGYAKDNLN